jgi:hypothetical protein
VLDGMTQNTQVVQQSEDASVFSDDANYKEFAAKVV